MRTTYSVGIALPITIPTQLLHANPYRLYFTIDNHDAANYLAFSPNQRVTAGVYDANEGTHLAAGDLVNGVGSKQEVWAVANTAPVNITVTEVTEIPDTRRP